MSLSDSEVRGLTARMQVRRAELAAAIETRLHGHGLERHVEASLPQRTQDTDDDAVASQQREADVERLARLTRELDRIEQAIGRVREGVYGVCVDCGSGVEKARLLAAPEVDRCLRCQTRFEQFSALHAGRF